MPFFSAAVTRSGKREVVRAPSPRAVSHDGQTSAVGSQPPTARSAGSLPVSCARSDAMNTFQSVVFGSLGRESPFDDSVRTTLAADVIVANAPDPVFVCDLRGKILEANAAVSQLLGLRRDEVLEQSVSRFLSPPEAREFVAAVRAA